MDFNSLSRKLMPLLLLALALPGVSAAASGGRTHTVGPRDNLSSIAREYLGDATLWRDIWNANPQIAVPTKLEVGQVLKIPPAPVARRQVEKRVPVRRTARGLEIVKLEPQIRSTPLEAEVITIPRAAIAPFLRRPRVLDASEAIDSAYVVGQGEGRLTGGTGDHLFVGGLTNPDQVRYGVYREGGPFRDVTHTAAWAGWGTGATMAVGSPLLLGSVLGYEGILVAEAEVLKYSEEGESTLLVTEAFQEVLNGDLIIPLEEGELTIDYVPKVPSSMVSGHVIKVPSGTSQAGQFDVVALSLGLAEGMEQGDLLDIFQAATTSYDVRRRRNVSLPQERVGIMMILRSYEKVSFAIILEAKRAIRISDRVTNPS